MSANAESTTPQQPANKKGKRKSALLLLTLLFIIIAVAYGIYWFLVLRHAEETDDAYVAGNQVQIMAQVSGSVTKVWADNTDFVQQGDVLVTLDPTDAQQAFEKAQTGLASSVRQTRQLMINSKQLQASIDVQKTALTQAQIAAADWVLVVCGYDAAALDSWAQTAVSDGALVALGARPGQVRGRYALSLSATPDDMR